MHPFAITSCRHDPSVAQVRQVSGNFGLRLIQNLYEVADTDFLVAHQVQQAESGIVPQRLTEFPHIKTLLLSYSHIRDYIRIDRCV